jgi:hypothetical protein
MTMIIDGTNGLTFNNATTQASAAPSAPVSVANGGTGLTSVGTSGYVLTSNGTAWASTAPAASGLGVGQTWQNVSGSRSLGTTYTNSTGKPIGVAWQSTSGYNPTVVVDGVTIITSTSYLVFVFIVVPNGSTYSISTSNSYVWCELR